MPELSDRYHLVAALEQPVDRKHTWFEILGEAFEPAAYTLATPQTNSGHADRAVNMPDDILG